MKKLVAMVLALMLALAVCSAFAEETVTLKIAHIGPTTGPAALYGLATQHGAEIAVDEINAEGGKFQIELINEDDEHNVEKVINAYNAALDAGAQMILGTTTSKPCEAAGAQGYAERVFFLTPSASSVAVIEDKDNVFQVCFTDPNQGSASALYIADHKLGSKIAVIYNNADVYSTGIRDTFVEKSKELGLEIVSEETFTDETTDFTVQVGKAQEAGAEIVFLPMYYTPASLILKTAADKNFKPIFFGVDGMDGILSVEGFDTSLAEGVMLLTPFVATSEDEKVKSFVAKYQEKYNEIPIQFAADAYDGIYALVAAAEKAGITSDMTAEEACDPLIEAMKEIQVDGLTGSMTWDESGAVTKTPMAATLVNGEYVFED
ncbi:MAG: ABC transporter substrate-binding protein [Clostridia bacterium]|nr:ABC transporter substrate-binding protein [Clostridia bacterium]